MTSDTEHSAVEQKDRLHRFSSRRFTGAAPFVLAVATVLVLTMPIPSAAATGAPDGLRCESNAANTFSLDARSGYVATPDGNSIYMWSYASATKGFQLPGPMLCVDSGVQVTVILHNTLPEATSIVFSGQHQQKANGHPTQPQVDGTGQLTSLTDAAPATNGSVTYTFTAGSPGTYLYESGTDVAKQREMGLTGALVIRPPGQPDHANGRADSLFDSNREYVYLLSEVDPDLHLAVERKRAFDVTKTRARYFFINGRSMPDTIAPSNAAWLPNQPYGSLVHLKPVVPGDPNSKPALVRYLNAGSVNYPFHPHGNDQRVITEDGQPVQGAGTGYGSPLSAFDDETALVLSEVDPSFNANPMSFDLRKFQPIYRLINGKAYPETAPIATAAGRRVLLRYVNAGLSAHAMGTSAPKGPCLHRTHGRPKARASRSPTASPPGPPRTRS
jgi:hypothetical protein